MQQRKNELIKSKTIQHVNAMMIRIWRDLYCIAVKQKGICMQ